MPMILSGAVQPPKPRRHWRRRKHARTQEILNAAAALMTEYGAGALKMDAIAERAGVTKGTVYLYFINKDDIVRRLSELTATSQDEAPAPEPQTLAAE